MSISFVILNGTSCIFLYFQIPCKIPSIMTYHLTIFDFLFRNNKQLNIDIIAILTGICAKALEVEQNKFHIPILVFNTYLTVVTKMLLKVVPKVVPNMVCRW